MKTRTVHITTNYTNNKTSVQEVPENLFQRPSSWMLDHYYEGREYYFTPNSSIEVVFKPS